MIFGKKSLIGNIMELGIIAYLLNGALTFLAPYFNFVNPLAVLFLDPMAIIVFGLILIAFIVDLVYMTAKKVKSDKSLIK